MRMPRGVEVAQFKRFGKMTGDSQEGPEEEKIIRKLSMECNS
jgi:hypothetical protein